MGGFRSENPPSIGQCWHSTYGRLEDKTGPTRNVYTQTQQTFIGHSCFFLFELHSYKCLCIHISSYLNFYSYFSLTETIFELFHLLRWSIYYSWVLIQKEKHSFIDISLVLSIQKIIANYCHSDWPFACVYVCFC